jgi:hypothetical protein
MPFDHQPLTTDRRPLTAIAFAKPFSPTPPINTNVKAPVLDIPKVIDLARRIQLVREAQRDFLRLHEIEHLPDPIDKRLTSPQNPLHRQDRLKP